MSKKKKLKVRMHPCEVIDWLNDFNMDITMLMQSAQMLAGFVETGQVDAAREAVKDLRQRIADVQAHHTGGE